MSKWKVENPEGRVFALIFTEEWDYQVAQWEPMLGCWSFYYMNSMRSVDPLHTFLWWHKLPMPPHNIKVHPRIFAVEDEDASL